MDDVWVTDAEVFQDYTLFGFYNGDTWRSFRHTDFKQLRQFVTKDMTLVTYNGAAYDLPILYLIFQDDTITARGVYEISKEIINAKGQIPPRIFQAMYAKHPWANALDCYQILNKKGGLKDWMCALHLPSVVESGSDFDLPLPRSEWAQIETYNKNDILATWALYQKCKPLVELRTKIKDMYGLGNRLYSLGDAGVSQAIWMDSYSKRTGGYSKNARAAAEKHEDNRSRCWKMTEIISDKVRFESDEFKAFFKMIRECSLMGDTRGTTWGYSHPSVADIFKKPIMLGLNQYQIGVGGLHSVDAPSRFSSNDDVVLVDVDAQSFYPSLIIEEKLYPPQFGPAFLDDYIRVRDMRIAAKKKGDKTTADAYKLLLNSTFGLWGNQYSPSKNLKGFLKIVCNGQLQLLMLAEKCWLAGFRILSANTDGITMMLARADLLKLAVISQEWQKQTHHTLEQVEYSTYVRRDVNSYLAMKTDGSVKSKGAFELFPVGGKTDEAVVKHAATNYLLNGEPIAKTVSRCSDIRDFIYYQRVKNGGTVYHADQFVGKTARWYVGKTGAQIRRKNPDGSFENLPDGRNAVLALTLPTRIPDDLDRSYYVHRACELVEAITNPAPPKKPRVKKVEL